MVTPVHDVAFVTGPLKQCHFPCRIKQLYILRSPNYLQKPRHEMGEYM